jgi:hypothetical protein
MSITPVEKNEIIYSSITKSLWGFPPKRGIFFFRLDSGFPHYVYFKKNQWSVVQILLLEISNELLGFKPKEKRSYFINSVEVD